jgi:hypothetical protein
MLRPVNSRIPVTAGPRLVEMADPQRAEVLMRAPNVRALRYRHTIVELQILDYGDSSRVPAKWGNAQKLSTDLESDDNPARVWKFKSSPVLTVARSIHY